MHITAVSGQKMEVDFAGKTFQMVEHLITALGREFLHKEVLIRASVRQIPEAPEENLRP